MFKRVCLGALLLLVPHVAAATTIAIDNFEGTLAAWTPGSGVIAVDPLNPSNHAVHFRLRAAGGDIWTNVSYGPFTDYYLSFDYLGVLTAGGNANDIGGFIGVDTDQVNAGIERWIGGTQPGFGNIDLIDDGAWHSYTVHFTLASVPGAPVGSSLFVKLEDYSASGGVAGDAYFDNISISDVAPAAVPEPTTVLLVAVGAAALFVRKRRK
ncbi:MAG: PEP-CTERM sorting domain-containing protein [Acidobacteriota bacterium]